MKKQIFDRGKCRQGIVTVREWLVLLFLVELVVLFFSNETVAGWPVISWVLGGVNIVVNFLLGLVGLYPAPQWMEALGANPVAAFLLAHWGWVIPLLIAWTYIHEWLLQDKPPVDVGKWATGLRPECAREANRYHEEMKELCHDAFTGEPGVRVQVFKTNVDRVYTWNERGEIIIDGIASGPVQLILRKNRAAIKTEVGLIPLERNVPHVVNRDTRGDVILVKCAITWLGGSV